MIFARTLRRFADRTLAAEIDRLEQELDDRVEDLREERSRVRILELEQDNLLSVIERDRRRIESEMKAYLARGTASELKASHNDNLPQHL